MVFRPGGIFRSSRVQLSKSCRIPFGGADKPCPPDATTGPKRRAREGPTALPPCGMKPSLCLTLYHNITVHVCLEGTVRNQNNLVVIEKIDKSLSQTLILYKFHFFSIIPPETTLADSLTFIHCSLKFTYTLTFTSL